jgi:lysozyme
MLDFEKVMGDLLTDEGVRGKPYRDSVGKLTIGVGRNLDDVGITIEEARFLLRNDILSAIANLDRFLPWWRNMDDVRQRVLVNMMFNLGPGKLLDFKNTLELLRCGQYMDAANAMLQSKWAKQVGARAQRLALMVRDGASNVVVSAP